MALAPSFYSTGTATVAANGTAVTGQGTSWLNAVQPGDVFGTHKGFPIRIASVNSNTSLTLAFAWPGGAQTAAAYEIMLMPDAGRVMETTRQLLDMLSDGDLAAIAALTSAADKVPYFTGAGAAALADLKAKGREIIAAVDTLGVLEKLGPVLGGPAPLPSEAGVGLSDGDFNTIVVEGAYTITGTWVNGPGGTTYTALLEVQGRRFDNLCVQTLRYNTGAGLIVWRRRSLDNGATWDAWAVTDSPTIGIVSQSGGVPTGAIVERGSNANGEYAKFADGTMICTSPEITVAMNQATGGLYYSNAVTVPMPVLFNGIQPVGFGHASSTINAWVNARTAFGSWVGAAYTASSRASDTIRFGAIGRWF